VPVVQAPNVGAAVAASAAAGSAAGTADTVARQAGRTESRTQEAASVISVSILGFGGTDGDGAEAPSSRPAESPARDPERRAAGPQGPQVQAQR
jgi:hypothetical protein